MPKWPRHPKILEINTWVWLSDLSQKYEVSRNLSSVPAREWDAIAGFGFDAEWLMGVWERSPRPGSQSGGRVKAVTGV